MSVDAPGARSSRGRRVAQPVADLKSSDFRIYEDGSLLPSEQTQQTIASPQLALQEYTLLLMDMSSSVVVSDQLGIIRGAAQAWLAQLRTYQHVAVYAFDGGKTLYEIVPFGSSAAQGDLALNKLRDFELRDPATNLNGAVLLGLAELDKVRQADAGGAEMPLRLGNLVVLTEGVDRANRVSQRQMLDAVEATSYHVYALGLGRELDDSLLSRIGKSGYVRMEESAGTRAAFQELAELISNAARRYYLLRYCSPSRGGEHALRVEVAVPAGSGQLHYTLDASQFSPGCDVSRAPNLRRIKPR